MDLTDEQWAILEPLIPEEERIPKRKRGRPWRNPRDVLNGVLWILRTGAPWQDIPNRYPPYQTSHRRHLRGGKKGGLGVGKTKRSKGSKVMAVADRTGLPIAVCVTSASPHEVTLVEATLAACFAPDKPQRLIGDRAYDSDSLDERLAAQGIEMIAPHRRNRRKPGTQDGRKLRR